MTKDLKALIDPLADTLGDSVDTQIRAFRQSSEVFADPREEARAFCRYIVDLARQRDDRRTADLARYAEGMLWLQSPPPPTTEEHGNQTVTAGTRVEAAIALQQPEGFAPCRSRHIHLKRYRFLPPGYEDAPISSDGVYFLLFHRQPGTPGKHWPIDRMTALIVEESDGSRTIEELIKGYETRSGQTSEVRAIVEQTLLLLAEAGMLTFVRAAA